MGLSRGIDQGLAGGACDGPRFVPGANDKPSDNGPRRWQPSPDVLKRSCHLDLC
jgi:hypothetical protein